MDNFTEDKKIVLPEGEYAEYLATLAGNIADEKIRQREQKWRAIVGVALTAFAIFGFSNILSIEDEISSDLDLKMNTKIPIAVEKYVTSNREKILGDSLNRVNEEVESRIAFMQLFNISLELSQGDGFSPDQRDTAASLIQKVSKNAEIVDSPEFAAPIEKIIDAFLRADQSLYIDKIESNLGSRLEKSSGISLSMVQHYGMRLSGSIEIEENDNRIFKKYSRVVSDVFKTPEAPAPYQIAIDFKTNGMQPSEYGMGIIQDVSNLKPIEVSAFFRLIDTLRNGEFYSEKTGEIERVEKLFKSMYEAYQEEFELLRSSIEGAEDEEQMQENTLEMLQQLLEGMSK